MPLIKDSFLAIPHSITLLLWKCSESVQELMQLVFLHDDELTKLDEITTEKRQKEFIVDRLLLQLNFDKSAKIGYLKNGKPFLENGTQHISYSHSHDMVILAISDSKIGIDLQYFTPQIVAVKQKYLSSSEWVDYARLNESNAYLQVLWSAKEAIFKIYGENVPFKEIIADCFEPDKKGELTFSVKNENCHQVHYTFFEEYCFCLAL